MKSLAIGALTISLMAGSSFAGEKCNAKRTMNTSLAQKKNLVETAAAAGSFKTLIAAVKAAGLAGAVTGDTPLTVFAPTDAAFAKLPKGTVETLLKPENKKKLQAILKYHVVAGRVKAADVVKIKSATTLQGASAPIVVKDGKVMVAGVNVVKTDIDCSNGIIHVVDAVMMPPADIVDTAAKAGSFKTLLAAAKAAGLVDALKGDGPLTVFAPTDEAFAKLPKGTVETLLKKENKDKLAAILKYHVVSGRVMAADVVKLKKAKTLQGGSAKITVSGGKVMVDKANVVKTDIDCGNGVIHVIDSVILPH